MTQMEILLGVVDLFKLSGSYARDMEKENESLKKEIASIKDNVKEYGYVIRENEMLRELLSNKKRRKK